MVYVYGFWVMVYDEGSSAGPVWIQEMFIRMNNAGMVWQIFICVFNETSSSSVNQKQMFDL